MAKEEDPKVQSEGTLALQALANELDTLSQRMKNVLTAANIEYPEDSQEGNTDRKGARLHSEELAVTNGVWQNVGRVNAKILDVIEITKQQGDANKSRYLDSLEVYDAVSLRANQNFQDTVEKLALVHGEVVRSGNDISSQVVSGNQVASTREVAQDTGMDDLLKTAISGNAALVEIIERIQNDSNKPKDNQPNA